jgi:hypothetical protein
MDAIPTWRKRPLETVLGLGVFALVVQAVPSPGQTLSVRHQEGLVHGFLTLKTLDGVQLADGDLLQNANGDRVTTRLLFHFKDGSVHDDTAVYSQKQRFRLITDHLIQKGPAFPRSLDMQIDGSSGQVTVRYMEDGKEKVESERVEIPQDLANGLLSIVLKNTPDAGPQKTVSLIAATPKPRLVRLAISVAGVESFSTGDAGRKAIHYVLKVELGGLTGVLASLLGKNPPDSHVWILAGDTPAFVKAEQPFFLGGPLWRIELVSPVWPKLDF